MTDKERHILDVYRHGESAVLSVITGTTCPCYTAKGKYSLDWHRNNPGTENCQGTLLIDRTTTNTNIKWMVYPVALKMQSLTLTKEQMTVIGEIQEDDLVSYGIVSSAGAEIDITALNEEADYVTYNSQTYFLRHYFPPLNYLRIGFWRRKN